MRVEFFQIKLADAPLTSHPLHAVKSLLCFSPPDVKNLAMLCRASGNDMSQCDIRFITSDWKRASARLHDTECAGETLPKTQTFKLHMSQNWLSQYMFLVLLSVIHQCTLFQWAKKSHALTLIMLWLLSDVTYLFCFSCFTWKMSCECRVSCKCLFHVSFISAKGVSGNQCSAARSESNMNCNFSSCDSSYAGCL